MKKLLIALILLLTLTLSGCDGGVINKDYEYICEITFADGSSQRVTAEDIEYRNDNTKFIIKDENDIIISNSTAYICIVNELENEE